MVMPKVMLLIGKGGKDRRLARGSQEGQSVDRAQWSFGRLLDWHLLRGTRSGGKIEHPGRKWSAQALDTCVAGQLRRQRRDIIFWGWDRHGRASGRGVTIGVHEAPWPGLRT